MQVLRNYISNAFKFSLLIAEGSYDFKERRKAGIFVFVDYEWAAHDKQLMFYVKDRGIGMNEYQVSQLWRQFTCMHSRVNAK
jgi:signal transduction histidine kinase